MAATPTVWERSAPDPALVTKALSGTEQRVFWLDEAPPSPVPEQLTANTSADLVVVGGGYLGLWTAVLAKRRDPGRSVVVLESETVGWAASGRNGGFCEASITHGEENGRNRWPAEYDLLHRLGRENLDAFARDVEELSLDCHFERTGSLAVAVEPHQVPWLSEDDDATTPGHAVLDAAATREEINSPIFLAGRWDRDDVAMLQPARLARELARAARDLGVRVFEHSAVTSVDKPSVKGGPQVVRTARAAVTARQVVLATGVFPPLLRRDRLMTVPVYDYVLMTEPLTAEQKRSVGWENRQGLTDIANQFHYIRLSADDRILFGGYDAIHIPGGRIDPRYEDRPATYERLASHFFTMFPQLEDVRFSHRWAGAIDTCTRFAAYYGTARKGQLAYARGFTGLGVGATRFAADVLLDVLSGTPTERTELDMVRRKPLPFPPEPATTVGVALTKASLDAADHHQGRRNLFLKALDAAGLGFDS
ncbi:Glycine/D-amino acid oxidase [Quadrisphaera granulorum]|uniref:Glycine/D-amino acid oxidase-like deaminating enzyme n=1 Tax=Quadrisphaera granulorum TaxID=317664 RepID=A0A316AAX9_9ACTN|nr:FAD-dependent oxidoreductase [Quadrisphaera granulorum]PWJ46967.1 glycine/D-amino acid oxidase-like deaminating enzyme [Quadrisphaera granulorum]SZE98963.1 Glycine/D-amino acid oxidase [Quadrisphaera granulorum]